MVSRFIPRMRQTVAGIPAIPIGHVRRQLSDFPPVVVEKIQAHWRASLHNAKQYANVYRPGTDIGLGTCFFNDRHLAGQFPSINAAKEDAKKLILGKNDLELGFVFGPANNYTDDNVDHFGRQEVGRYSFAISVNQLNGTEPADAAKLGRLSIDYPSFIPLSLEAASRLCQFSQHLADSVRFIIVNMILYRVLGYPLNIAAHHDGGPAIHVPILSSGCVGTTTFQNGLNNPTMTISGHDIPVVTDDGFLHQVSIDRTGPKLRPGDYHSRVIMNVMVYF